MQDLSNTSIILPGSSGPVRLLDHLSTLRAPATRTMAAFGDSITAGANNTSANTLRRANFGYATWVPILTRQRVTFPWEMNFGVNGDSTTQMVARLSAVLAAKPNICVVHGGTNDAAGGTGTPASTIIANLTQIYDALAAVGSIVIAIPILARGPGATTWTGASNYQIALAVNSWIRRQGYSRPGFYVADAGLVFDDPAATAFTNLGLTQDGLHPDPRGAYVIAKKVAAIINAIYPDDYMPMVQAADIYSANNPYGSFLANGVMAGTGGTASGGATGSVATSWGISGSGAGGGTVAASKVTLADGRVFQRVDLSGTFSGTAQSVNPSHSLTLSGLAAGDIIEAVGEYSIDAGQQNVAGVGLQLSVTHGGVTSNYQDGWSNNTFAFPTEAHSGIFRTPPLTLTATPSAGTLFVPITLKNVGGVSSALAGGIQFGSISVRKVGSL